MSWVDRLKEAAYTSPSGRRFIFEYEDVRNSIEKRTTAFNFPDRDGTYIQSLGHNGRRYPLRLIFWGENYDIEASAFDDALLERGVGRLEHPIYGTKTVVPFGEITRRDDLKTAANQTIYDVVFFETTGEVYPNAQDDPVGSVLTAVDEYNTAAADEFEQSTNLVTSVDKETAKTGFKRFLDVTKSGLNKVAETQQDVAAQFDAIFDSINNSVDILIGQPLTLATQTLQMIQAPSRAVSLISARLEAYGNLFDSLTDGGNSTQSPSLDNSASNQFHITNLYASTYITGSILSAVNNEYLTKSSALDAAEQIIDQFTVLVDWRDNNFESLGEIDTGQAYQQLQEAVAIAADALIQISFSLKQERKIKLSGDRIIIDLAAELYGEVDDRLDDLIRTNDLTPSEILELPRGREIVYYV